VVLNLTQLALTSILPHLLASPPYETFAASSDGFVFLLLSSTGGWGLPPCPEKGVWTDCFGTYKSDDGTKYIGEWKDDQSHGQGTETYANGDKYVGQWMEGKYHGQGIKTYADGTIEKGKWENNEYVRIPYKNFNRGWFDPIDCLWIL